MGNEGTKSRRGGYPGQNASYPPADGHEDSGRIATSLLKKARRAAHVRWLPPCLSQKHYLGAITHAYTTCKSPISEHLVRCLHRRAPEFQKTSLVPTHLLPPTPPPKPRTPPSSPPSPARGLPSLISLHTAPPPSPASAPAPGAAASPE